ncbi:hypothetical protein ACIPY5_12015 [Microbacterium sp. NPDC089698]|uniref:hypothetical protein n=1 Tax=Microbacterium sp. NPDC089698 TaxID=3364200 RepID=UPI00382D9314
MVGLFIGGFLFLNVLFPSLEDRTVRHTVTGTVVQGVDGISLMNTVIASAQGSKSYGKNYQITYLNVELRRDASSSYVPKLSAVVATSAGKQIRCQTPNGPNRWSYGTPTKVRLLTCETFVPFEELADWNTADIVIR